MVLGTKKYILRFGAESKKDMLVKFRGDETLRENLARVIPSAIHQGVLPESCSVDFVEVDHKDRTLRVKPDKSSPIVESVTVGPNNILKDALKDFMGELRHKHKFYGRRFKKYNLMLGERKLDLDRSLKAQDVRKDIEVVFKPRILFEWPPGLFWPPGPYTTYVMGGVVVALVVAFILIWSWARKEEFRVTLKSAVECKFYSEDDRLIGENESPVQRLSVGTYVFRIFPKDYPMYEDTLVLKPAWREEVVHQVDPQAEFRGIPERSTRIRGQYSNQPGVSLPPGIDVLVNRYHYPTDTHHFADIDIRLPLGIYEIEYDLEKQDCREINLSGKIIRPQDFVIDLTDSAFIEKGWVQFKYFLED
jgi:hypothetical protein